VPDHFVQPGDPDQCEGHFSGGQCRHRAEPGDKFCKGCGGKNQISLEARRQYLLKDTRHATRLAQFAEHEDIKSLREEIGLARVLLERRFNLIKDDSDLLQACGPINGMLLTIERLVKTSHQIETNLGVLLTRNTVLKLAQAMCEIVIDEIQSVPGFEEIVDRLSQRLLSAVLRANNDDTKRIEAIDVEFARQTEPVPEDDQRA
jgi:hypothetical protein